MRILLGGIPLGCDNIGDEAILACVVRMLRERVPDVALTVATNDPATGSRLGVAVVPPYGFARTPATGFDAAVRAFDAYIWCGATGLSDYPFVALDLLRRAQRAGVPTFVWAVGMDAELNPVFFRAQGLRRKLLSCVGAVGLYERFLRARLARQIRATLPACASVWTRDRESAAQLAKFGFPDAGIAADTAIGQSRLRLDAPPRAPGSPPTVGLCLSAQRTVSDTAGVRRFLARLAAAGVRVVGIPMNPKTDAAILRTLGVADVSDGTTPEAVAAQAAACDLVVSSRLHLLILAANVGTPGVGIARGSKIANWLANFGERPIGSVEACDWEALTDAVLARLGDPSLRSRFATRRRAVYARLDARLELAKRILVMRLGARSSSVAV